MTKEEQKKEREEYIESVKTLINANFRATELEKHPMATLEFWVSEYLGKFHGKSKKRISQNTQKKVHQAVVKKLRSMYGQWISIRLKNPKHWNWDTNLGQVFKTEQGRIYGTNLYDDLYITSHALERWEQRTKLENWQFFNKCYQKRYNVTATALDHTMFAIETAVQVGITPEIPYYRYLNVNGGIFVIEILEGIMIVKTFLNYHMRMPTLIWYGLDPKKWLTEMALIIDPDSSSQEELVELDEQIPADFAYWYFRD